jgi:hypothetical protein
MRFDGSVKSRESIENVIPAKAGIQENSTTSGCPRIAVRDRLLKSGMTVLRLFTSKSGLNKNWKYVIGINNKK